MIGEKYGMSAEEFMKAIKDGLVSTSWIRKEEICVFYKKRLSAGDTSTMAAKATAAEFNCEPSYVFQIIKLPVFQ